MRNWKASTTLAFFTTLAALLFSAWRIVVCFREYNMGPYVAFGRALVDLLPFLIFPLSFSLLRTLYPPISRGLRRSSLFARIAFPFIIVFAVIVAGDIALQPGRLQHLIVGQWQNPMCRAAFREDGSAEIRLFAAKNQQIVQRGTYLLVGKRLTIDGIGTGSFRKDNSLELALDFQSRLGRIKLPPPRLILTRAP